MFHFIFSSGTPISRQATFIMRRTSFIYSMNGNHNCQSVDRMWNKMSILVIASGTPHVYVIRIFQLLFAYVLRLLYYENWPSRQWESLVVPIWLPCQLVNEELAASQSSASIIPAGIMHLPGTISHLPAINTITNW